MLSLIFLLLLSFFPHCLSQRLFFRSCMLLMLLTFSSRILFLNFFQSIAMSFRRFWTIKLIIIGSNHAIVDFPVFICFSANIPFRIFIAGDQIHRPGIQPLINLSDLPIQFRKHFLIFQSFPIRRIGDQKTIFFRMTEFCHFPLLKICL